MILKRVSYEVFASDAEWLDAHPTSPFHEVDREVKLEFEDAPAVFISWTWTKGQEDYSIATSPSSFFTSPPEVVRDMTSARPWAPLIGQEVSIESISDDGLVFTISNTAATVYCAAADGDNRGVDTLWISDTRPR